MFEHLIQPANEITVQKVVLNRDSEVESTTTIGTAYGMFWGLSEQELGLYGVDRFSFTGLLMHYNLITEAPALGNARTKYVCVWRNKTYEILKISEKIDVHGNPVGYKVYV